MAISQSYRKHARKSRAFRPAVVGLEDRNLLSLTLLGRASTLRGSVGTTIWPSIGAGGPALLGTIQESKFGTPVQATVDWGDGSAPQAATVTAGFFSSTVSQSHAYGSGGTYTIKVTASDGSGTPLSWTDYAQITGPTAFQLTEQTPVGTTKDIVGAPFRFDVTQVLPGFAPYWIEDVTWKVVGGLKDAYVDNTGYHATSIAQAIADGSANEGKTLANDWWIAGFWNSAPGTHHVEAVVDFRNANGQDFHQDLTLDAKVQAPTGNMVATTSGVAVAKELPNPPISGPDYTITTWGKTNATPGISIDASVDPNLTSPDGTSTPITGTFGIIQTFTSDVTFTELSTGQQYRGMVMSLDRTKNYANSPLPTFVDYQPGFDTAQAYYPLKNGDGKFITTPVAISAGHAFLNDSPHNSASIDTSMHRYDKFTDTLMFTPSGGIPVPIGMLQWDWGYDFKFPIMGGRAIGSSMAPTVTAQYAPTITIPTWQENTMDFISPKGKSLWVPIGTKKADGTPLSNEELASAVREDGPTAINVSLLSDEDRNAYLAWLDTLIDASPLADDGEIVA